MHENLILDAIQSGNIELVKFLINSKKPYFYQWSEKYTKAAIKSGNIELLKYLFETGATSWYTVTFACDYGQLEILKYLLEIDTYFQVWALINASVNKHIHIVRFFLIQEEHLQLLYNSYSEFNGPESMHPMSDEYMEKFLDDIQLYRDETENINKEITEILVEFINIDIIGIILDYRFQFLL